MFENPNSGLGNACYKALRQSSFVGSFVASFVASFVGSRAGSLSSLLARSFIAPMPSLVAHLVVNLVVNLGLAYLKWPLLVLLWCFSLFGSAAAEDVPRIVAPDPAYPVYNPAVTNVLGHGASESSERPFERLMLPLEQRQPSAALTVNPSSDDIANRYQFDATLLGTRPGPEAVSRAGVRRPDLKFRWKFGDGTALVGVNLSTVRHTFPPGEFVTVVSIEDTTGLLATASVKVNSVPTVKNALRLPQSSSVVPSTVELPATGSPKPPVDTPDKPPVSTPGKSPISTPDKSPISTPGKPAVPVNLSPATDELLSVGATVPFIWGAAAGASRYDFRILDAAAQEVVRVGEFAANEICSGKRCRLSQSVVLDARQHYSWQVRAGNVAGWSSWSTTEVYVVPVGVKVPRIPLALFPTAGDLLARGESTRFLWTHRDGVEGYQFQFVETQTKEALHSVRVNAGKACNATQCAFPRKINLPVSDNYAWQIRATNAAGESGWYRTAIKVVNGASGEPPVARFTHAMSKADPLVVNFDASGSSDDQSVVRFAWSFGEKDSEAIVVGDGPVIEHRFAEGGSYIAVLTVTDEAGLTASTFGQVDVGLGTAPQAHFTVSNYSGGSLRAPALLTFDPASSSGDSPLTRYTWDFADGTEPLVNTDAAIVSHVFSVSGEFTVRLRVTNELNLTDEFEKSITVLDSAQGMSVSEAGRFLAQGTFGANRQSLDQLRELGFEDWLSDQFELRGASHLDYVRQHALQGDRSIWQQVWWSEVVHGNDQLRQRVAFALSQLFSVSDTRLGIPDAQYAFAAWYDLLLEHAFGNYRSLLEAVTLSPVMGLWRGNLQNSASVAAAFRSLDGAAPAGIQADEGYARSLLNDFTLGEVLLEADGSTTGERAWNQFHVTNFARALTGWNLNGAAEWSLEETSMLDWTRPMTPDDDYHDKGSKTLLDGEVLPPGLSAEQDLRLALDNLFAAPNVGPFVAAALIRQLVTDNPAPAYIERVAAVFADNGQGVRGDLRAVVRSILLDQEARKLPDAGAPGASSYGKLRAPLFRLAHLWRAFSVQPGSASVNGELRSAGAYSQHVSLQLPTLGTLSASSLITTTSEITAQIQRYNNDNGSSDDLQFAYLDFGPELDLANRPAVLLKHLDTLLLAGNMSNDLYAHLLDHLQRVPNTTAGRSTRVRDAISLIMASPDYLVQM